METFQSLFSGLACCSTLNPAEKKAQEIEEGAAFTITCFDESDTELRDVKVYPHTKWSEMQMAITETLGGQAMFAYDDGTGVDLPVRNEKEWDQFLEMLKTDQSINGEYDILLLPAGSWSRYEKEQKAKAAQKAEVNTSPSAPKPDTDSEAAKPAANTAGKEVTPLGRKEYGEVYSAVSALVEKSLISGDEENKIYDLIAVSNAEVVKAYRAYQGTNDLEIFATEVKACL
mmetsp:Transcript_7084/g.11156  ORF Transcript_7084/g.11156 Transcript_7084/m.11156 type:complete len:230 (-) Transcript_7084:283-972(-)|eukprot:CAMPEP_0184300140 /NCGR_PEP_ID=MMETSP1049-20130417/10619_1 /TAXON_ID=77928 /ORGANISM="Proteomonas sulcata, Strain CCMP704" /LENGTH=229 /DNA_ID=CAMNT_0026610787 /DNA_START=79 /DNA_END=768 /DNA_ORIENTATION=+